MAFASQIPSHKIADKGPGTVMYSREDEDLLQQPFAVAVKDMMDFDRLDLILYATKLLQSQQQPLKAPTVMMEVEKLQEMERRGKRFPPLAKKAREMDNSGSAGESDGESLEYYDADDGNQQASSSKSDDLQTDCAEPARQADITEKLGRLEPETKQAQIMSPSLLKAAEMQPQLSRKEEIPREPKRKLDNGKDLEGLKLKLQVLRSENKRLKERQLCRDCHSKQVSITFLPCGHYSYCYDCGQRFSACPICRKTILADVRTFLA